MQSLQSLFKEKIADQNAVFVFPTDIASSKWADWCVKNTPVKAVAMERFMAWDYFKGERIRGKSENLNSVPALLRKIFVSVLIKENSENHFFKSLISQKYADNAAGFADWISSILPSLKMWKNLREASSKNFAPELLSNEDENLQNFFKEYKKSGFSDDEDEDLDLLYEKYSDFLEKNNLFEPAWVVPDFSDDGREYFLIYPETLEDWEQYKHQLSKVTSVHIISVPESEKDDYESYFFENSSLELKDVALFLRENHDTMSDDKNKIEWSDVALSVPNLDDYGSYLDRALGLYSIPHTMRYSRPLSTYGAGALFSQILECVENNFSYESVKNLLLNEDIPWANKSSIEDFLLFGRINNCICTPGELNFNRQNNKKNENGIKTVWSEAFEHPKNDSAKILNNDFVNKLYTNIITILPKMVTAGTFDEIRSAYEEFKKSFFKMSDFQTMKLSDNVLSRCITTLNELIDLEEKYPAYRIASPFSFFVSHLSKVQYLSQGENRAVQVYPYITAAAAPYKIHIVLDSTQDSLSVADSFKPLNFLNDNKRRLFLKMGEMDTALGFSESDPSFDFIKMYQHSALQKTYFTAARHAFDGKYGFAYGKMAKTTDKTIHRKDLYLKEKNALLDSPDKILGGVQNGGEAKLFAKQVAGLSNWKKISSFAAEDTGLFEKNDTLTKLLQEQLHYQKENVQGERQKNEKLLGKIQVSQSTLKSFFDCPRKWLFKNILKLDPLDKEAELINEFIMGTVNHKVFENFLAKVKESERKTLRTSADNPEKLDDEYRTLLISAINEAVDSSKDAKNSAFTKIFSNKNQNSSREESTTTIKIIASQYRIDDEKTADENPNFRMLEKSLAHLCKIFTGFTVHALEKTYCALPSKDFIGEKTENWDGYYFLGKIDCILAGPNEKEFAIIDFKTSSLPSNLKVQKKVDGQKEKVIDFQMPLYLYLVEHSIDEHEKLDNVTTAIFYSIKNATEKLFLGTPPNGEYKPNSIPEPEDVAAAKSEMQQKAKLFYELVSDEHFAVDRANQSRLVCTAKGEFDNCIDYQALCRRYFTVSGESIEAGNNLSFRLE